MLAGNVHEPGQPSAAADEDAPEAGVAQVLQGRGLADDEVLDERATEQLDLPDDVVDQVVRQPELGDAVAQHPTERVERLEHSDREPLRCEQVRVDQTGRSRADDGDRWLGSDIPRVGDVGVPLSGGIRIDQLLPLRQVPLHLSDLDRHLGVQAHSLALQLLRTHSPGHVRQRVARLQQLQRLAEPTGADQLEHLWDVDLHRAATLARPVLGDEDAELTGLLRALLVPHGLQPDEQLDVTRGVPQGRVPEVPLVDEVEVGGPGLGVTHVGRDAAARGPVEGQPVEHRVAIGQVLVQGADERPLLPERKVPQESHQHGTGGVVPLQHPPQRLGELDAEVTLVELPGDRVHPLGDEELAERLRLGEEPAAEQFELPVERLDPLGTLELGHPGPGGLEGAARLQVVQDVVLR